MNKFKISLYGFHKQSVSALVKLLQSEHAQNKQILESELNEISSEIQNLKEDVRLQQEGGREK